MSTVPATTLVVVLASVASLIPGAATSVSSPIDVTWLSETGDVRKVTEGDYESLEVFCHPAQNISVFKFW